MRSATAIALRAILIAIMTFSLFYVTSKCLEVVKEEPLSLKTVSATILYTFVFILIVVIVLLGIAFVLALASD
jgi:hypothetical protein